MNRIRLAVFLALASTAGSLSAEETRWGSLSGRFLFDGDPPARKTLKINKDVNELGHSVVDESLIVNERNGGVANVLVFLLPARQQQLRVHPSYEKTAKAKVELAMHQGRFVPHITLLRTTQTMVQRNKDEVAHNAKIDFFENLPR